MANYVDLAKKANEVEDVKLLAEKNAPRLEARLKAVIASQEAKVMEAEAELADADVYVDTARGMLTADIVNWLSSVNNAKERRDIAAAELEADRLYLDELKTELKIFS